MPRPGPRRMPIGLRLHRDGVKAIERLAEEAGVMERTEMIRRLLLEALAARGVQAKL